MSALEDAREQARAALELIHKWRQREQAWDTPRALDFERIGVSIRALLDAAEPPAQTEPTDAQIEVIADSIESFFEEHIHMARRLYPDVWKRDLALVVLKAAFTAGQEDNL